MVILVRPATQEPARLRSDLQHDFASLDVCRSVFALRMVADVDRPGMILRLKVRPTRGDCPGRSCALCAASRSVGPSHPRARLRCAAFPDIPCTHLSQCHLLLLVQHGGLTLSLSDLSHRFRAARSVSGTCADWM